MKFLFSTGQVFLVQVVGGTCSIFTGFFLAAMLQPADRGVSTLLVIIPGLIVVITNLGFQASAVYLVSKKKYPVTDILSTTVSLTLCISITLTLLCIVAFPLILKFIFHDIPSKYVLIALSSIPSYLLAFYLGDIFWAMNLPKFYVLIRLLSPVVYLVISIITVGIAHWGLFGAVVAFAVGIHTAGIVSLILVAKQMNKLKLTYNKALLAEAMSYGIRAYLGKLAQQAVYRLDVPLVNYFAGSISVGYYSVAVSLTEMIWYIQTAITFVLFPIIAKTSTNEANRITPFLIRTSLWASCIVASLLAIVSYPLISVVLPAYRSTLPLFWLLIPGVIIANIFQIILSDLMGRGNPEQATLIASVGLIFSLILYFVLIPLAGATGAALASTLVYTLQAAVALVVWARKANYKISVLLIPNQRDFEIYLRLWKRIQTII